MTSTILPARTLAFPIHITTANTSTGVGVHAFAERILDDMIRNVHLRQCLRIITMARPIMIPMMPPK